MRLFGYYAAHALWNQIRKLCRTWVVVFILVCALGGGLIGVGVAMLEDKAEENSTDEIEETIDKEPIAPAELAQRLELIAGGAILALFVYEALSAEKNGSAIFQPADVALLFPSPMKPQGVLMFRLGTQIGMAVFAGLYMLLQLPNLTVNLGLGLVPALSLILLFALTVLFGKLVQLSLYLLGSNHARVRRGIRPAVYALLALVLAVYLAAWRRGDGDALATAKALFNAPATRWIPVWGWLKGLVAFACEGKLAPFLVCFGLLLAVIVLLVWAIGRMKVDFYEDAMAKSEETAELQREVRENGMLARKGAKAEHADSVRRDGLRHGWGASVFFHKTLYNRFRFARFGFLTKTTVTYLLAAAGASLLAQTALDDRTLLYPSLAIAALAFFRALGNPLASDIRMELFRSVPESPWKKMGWSLLGGSVCCLLDALPGLLLACLLQMTSPWPLPAWLLLILSVDFYATVVAAFIDLSIPSSTGETVKQLLKMLFIYFGLVPDAALVAYGIVTEQAVPFLLIAAAVNIALGLVFFGVAPLLLSGRSAPRIEPAAHSAETLRAASRACSRAWLALFVALAGGSLVQIAALIVVRGAFPELLASESAVWLLTFAPLYLIAVPACCLVLKKLPTVRRENHPWPVWRLLRLIPIAVFLMYAGNIMGSLLQMLLGSVDPIKSYAVADSVWLKTLFLAVLAPCIEEFLFRRSLIDRLSVYGEALSVVVSALAFGLFHGNLSQFFYAFFLGLLFGYVYLRTGRLRYTIALHVGINSLGSLVGPALLERAQLETLVAGAVPDAWTLAFLAYAALLLATAIFGLVQLCIAMHGRVYVSAPLELPREKRLPVAFGNVGMLLFLLASLALVVSTIVT